MSAETNILELLRQDEIWVDKSGATHRLAEMDAGHLANLKGWLERYAFGIQSAVLLAVATGPQPQGQQAGWDLADAFDEAADTEPMEFLADFPLYQRVAELVEAGRP